MIEIILTFTLFPVYLPPPVTVPEPPKVEEPIVEQPKVISIDDLIINSAHKYGVNPKTMRAVIDCETGGTFDPKLQSFIIDKDGNREESYGLAQFHLPARNIKPDGSVITYEDATDPEIALDAMAWHMSEGRSRMWTCYRDLFR